MTAAKRPPCPLEAEEASILVRYLRLRGIRFHHSPNETGHTPEAKRRANRMKQQGTSAGYPDYTIIVGGSLLFIELKRQYGSSTSQEQKDWITAINEVQNCQGFICKGADKAIKVIESFIVTPAYTSTDALF